MTGSTETTVEVVVLTIVEAADRLLPLEEPAAGELLAAVFRAEDIDVVTGMAATRVSHRGKFRVTPPPPRRSRPMSTCG